MFKPLQQERFGWLCAAALLLVFLAELTLSIRQQSVSWDEGDHLFAGYESLKRGDLGINPEHPPLVKALAALPLLPMHLKEPRLKGLPSFKDDAYIGGRELIFGNGGSAVADRIMFRARMAAATLSLLLGLLVFLAAREMFGQRAALFALALVVFEPNLIAHGAYVTTDMGVSCFMFASVYGFYRYCKAPSLGRLLLAGLAAGLALASKHSASLLLPIGLALLASELLRPRTAFPPAAHPSRARDAGRLVAALAAIAVVAVFVLWAFYGFRYAARPAGLALHPTLPEYAAGLKGLEPHIYLALARWHILPESYLYGLIDIRLVSGAFPSYLFGKIYAHGVPLYFLAAFVIKSTAAFLILLLLALFALGTRTLRARREVLFLLIPAVLYVAIALGTGLNIGARHILPIYAFLAVLIGGAVSALVQRNRTWALVAGLLLCWHVVSTTRSAPVYLAYSNEFFGGPSNTYKYLTDSSVDWGQQLKAVKFYVDANGIHDCWFAYFVTPFIQPADYSIPCKLLPTPDSMWGKLQIDSPPTITGPVFINVSDLTGYELGSNVLNPYRGYQKLTPDAVIQHGVFVFNGSFDNRFASALGHVTRSDRLTADHQPEAALQEAELAVSVDPDCLQAQMALAGDLTALHRSAEAQTAYRHALALVQDMEPSSKAEWVPKIEKLLQAQP